MGYIASIKKENIKKHYSKTKRIIFRSINRYIYFVLCGLLINTIIVLVNSLFFDIHMYGLIDIVVSSFTISNKINPIFWCMKSFLIASIFCYINSEFEHNPFLYILEFVFAILINDVWIIICLIGGIVYTLYTNRKETDIISNKYVKISLLLIIFFLIKRSESTITYIIDGICSGIFVLVLLNSSKMQVFFNNIKIQDKIYQAYIGIFMIHVTVISIYLNKTKITFIIDLILCLLCVVVIGYFTTKLINDIYRRIRIDY